MHPHLPFPQGFSDHFKDAIRSIPLPSKNSDSLLLWSAILQQCTACGVGGFPSAVPDSGQEMSRQTFCCVGDAEFWRRLKNQKRNLEGYRPSIIMHILPESFLCYGGCCCFFEVEATEKINHLHRFNMLKVGIHVCYTEQLFSRRDSNNNGVTVTKHVLFLHIPFILCPE